MTKKSSRFAILTAIASASILVTSNAISVMVFGSLGKTADNTGWSYVVALCIVLATTGLTAYLADFRGLKSRLFQSTCLFVSTLLGGAILGFYYGGTASNNNPQFATIAAITFGLIFGICTWQKYQIISVAAAFISALAAYGFGLYAGTRGIASLSASINLGGMIWVAVCLVYIAIALENFLTGVNKIIEYATQNNSSSSLDVTTISKN